MQLVNQHFLTNAWKNSDRNWVRGTYYTGLMAFYKSTGEEALLRQAENWAKKHGWRTGTEWTEPPNRLTCTQTYLDLYFIEPNEAKIKRTKSFMDKRLKDQDSAFEAGYDYADALYVGIPPYMMMGKAKNEEAYIKYGNRIFWELAAELYDNENKLFYRDIKARGKSETNGVKEFWLRGNGWVMASIPKILENLPSDHQDYSKYVELFIGMAQALKSCQNEDGFWRTDLLFPEHFPSPESSGTAFITYGIAWGINHGYLNREEYLEVVIKAWKALYHAVDEDGKVCWGQLISRDPGKVSKNDSHEYVSGAFLLAGSEILKLTANGEMIDPNLD